MLRPAALMSAVFLAALLPVAAAAQDEPAPTQSLGVELNSADSVDGACRLTFLVENGLGADLGQLALETVILTTDGIVERLMLFDFRDLPVGRPRVRQFDLGGISCDGIGAVLINGASACAGDGIDPAVCVDAMTLTSRVDDMEMLG